MRNDTFAVLREVVTSTGMRFSRLNYSVDSCNDDGTTPYKPESFGRFVSSRMLDESRREVTDWIGKLTARDWKPDSGSKTHGGTVLTRDSMQLFLYPVDPQDTAPDASFEFYGKCSNLPGVSNQNDLPLPEDILSQIQPS